MACFMTKYPRIGCWIYMWMCAWIDLGAALVSIVTLNWIRPGWLFSFAKWTTFYELKHKTTSVPLKQWPPAPERDTDGDTTCESSKA